MLLLTTRYTCSRPGQDDAALRHADAAQPRGLRKLLSSQLGLTAGSRSVWSAACTILGALHIQTGLPGRRCLSILALEFLKGHTNPVKAAGKLI